MALTTCVACTADSGSVANPTPPTTTTPAPPAASLKLMPLGDSITQGNTQLDSYRRPPVAGVETVAATPASTPA